MTQIQLIGNIFFVDRNINVKTILIAVAVTLLTGLLNFIFENETVFKNFTIQEFTFPLIATAIVLFVVKYKLIQKFIGIYFKLSLYSIEALIIYLLIFVAILYTGPTIYAYFLAILFFISGILRFIIQKTRALFFAEMSEFMDFIQIYGYVRVAFYSLVILIIYKTIALDLSIFLVIVLIFEIELITNLYPYCKKHEDIEKTILILRKIADNKNINVDELISSIDASNNFTKQQLDKLIKANYILKNGDYIKLNEKYQEIYEGKL